MEQVEQSDRDAAAEMALVPREPTEAMLEAAVPEPTHLYGEGERGADYQRDMKAAVLIERMAFRSKWLDAIDACRATRTDPSLQVRIGQLLGADPICMGRVCSSTIEAIAALMDGEHAGFHDTVEG